MCDVLWGTEDGRAALAAAIAVLDGASKPPQSTGGAAGPQLATVRRRPHWQLRWRSDVPPPGLESADMFEKYPLSLEKYSLRLITT